MPKLDFHPTRISFHGIVLNKTQGQLYFCSLPFSLSVSVYATSVDIRDQTQLPIQWLAVEKRPPQAVHLPRLVPELRMSELTLPVPHIPS